VSHPSPPRPRTSRPARGLVILAVALAALTACGGGDGGEATATGQASPSTETSPAEPPASSSAESPTDAQTVTATEGEMYIELSQEEFTAGSITFEVTNEGSATHDFVVERDGDEVAATETITPGSSTTLTVDLEPGEYVVYCSVGNHRALGMEVPVTVT
jgi:uncharacterized cupredoxin-like copper-binding protein